MVFPDLDTTYVQRLNEHNEEALQLLYSLCSPSKLWSSLPSEDISLHKRHFEKTPPPSYLSDSDQLAFRRHECIRGVGIIDAPPETVFEAFRDNAKVLEFNDNIESIRDLHSFPTRVTQESITWTKVSWSKASPKNIPFVKAREFYSVVSFTKFRNGTFAIVNRPAYIVDNKIRDFRSVRGSLLLSGNIFEPYQNKTKITQIIHINPGGSADSSAIAWILNRRQLPSYVFIKKLERVVLEDLEKKKSSLRASDHVQTMLSELRGNWKKRVRKGNLGIGIYSFKRRQ